MAADDVDLTTISNPLVTPEQLTTTSSRLDNVPADLEASLRFAGAQLTQAAGILLRLPQELIAQAIVIFYRYFTGAEGGSFRANAVWEISAASLFLTAKPSFHPQSTRSILNVSAYLTSDVSVLRNSSLSQQPEPEQYYLSEGDYMTQRSRLLQTETIILRTISFQTRVVTPHHIALTYLQTLGVLPKTPTDQSKALAQRTLEHLNTALLSPQLLYLTHQPTSLAVAAIYLAAKEVGVSLSSLEWWEVFDVDREELGFLVVGMLSCENWVVKEKERWEGGKCPLTVEEVQEEMKKRTDAE